MQSHCCQLVEHGTLTTANLCLLLLLLLLCVLSRRASTLTRSLPLPPCVSVCTLRRCQRYSTHTTGPDDRPAGAAGCCSSRKGVRSTAAAAAATAAACLSPRSAMAACLCCSMGGPFVTTLVWHVMTETRSAGASCSSSLWALPQAEAGSACSMPRRFRML